MKKTFFSFAIASVCLVAVSCGGSTSGDKISTDTTHGTDQNAVAQNPNAAQDTAGSIGTENTATSVATNSKGASLIASSDCLSCHKEHDKLVGPSYAEVAAKYTSADIDKLADKIIKGGSGSFGEVPMSPHPAVSVDDAKEMVKYILTVK